MRVGVVGCGYMGGTAVRALCETTNADILFIFDQREDVRRIAKQFCDERHPGVPILSSISEVTELLTELYTTNESTTLVYDASDPTFRFNHFRELRACGPHVHFIGEKPLVLAPGELYRLRTAYNGAPIYCNFIEVHNPVFAAARAYLRDHSLSPVRMWFWRAGSSAVKKLLRTERAGVQGGSLFDKGPHDLAITMNLIGPDGVEGDVVDCAFHALAIDPSALTSDGQTFMQLGGEPLKYLIARPGAQQRNASPADAACTLRVDWRSPRSTSQIRTDYLFSWSGRTGLDAEREIVARLQNLNITADKYLITYRENGLLEQKRFTHPLQSDSFEISQSLSSYTGTLEEARIALVECNDGTTIACNFLSKKYSQVKRFALAIHPNGRKETLFADSQISTDETKRRELLGVFHDVWTRHDQAYEVGRGVSLATHEILLNAHTTALQALKRDETMHDADYWFTRSAQLLYSKLVPQPLIASSGILPT